MYLPSIISVGTPVAPDALKTCAALFREAFIENELKASSTFLPFIEAFKKQKTGQLVGIASVAGIRGLPGSGAYSASKAALINYLESLRMNKAWRNGCDVNTADNYVSHACV